MKPAFEFLADEDVVDDLDGASDLGDLVHERNAFGGADDDMFRSLYEDPSAVLRARR